MLSYKAVNLPMRKQYTEQQNNIGPRQTGQPGAYIQTVLRERIVSMQASYRRRNKYGNLTFQEARNPNGCGYIVDLKNARIGIEEQIHDREC